MTRPSRYDLAKCSASLSVNFLSVGIQQAVLAVDARWAHPALPARGLRARNHAGARVGAVL